MSFYLEKVISHRGASGYAPENTIASIDAAHRLGAKWVEFDVMLTMDSEPIVIHDFTLNRTTNSSGEVSEKKLAFIQQLDGGSWFSEEFKGEKVPTFQELLLHASNLNLSVNVEIKSRLGLEVATTKKILEVLKFHWPSSSQLPLISSFSPAVLSEVVESRIPCFLGYNLENWNIDWQQIVNRFGCCSLHVDHILLTPERVQEIKDKCKYLLAFTVNEAERARNLFEWGVDAVFSNYPDKILALIK